MILTDGAVLTRRRGVRVVLLMTMAVAVVVVAALVATRGRADAAAPGQVPVGSAPIALTQPVDPLIGRLPIAPDAATNGMFGPQVGWPVIPVHAVLAATGHVITYGSPIAKAEQGGIAYDVWNPSRGLGSAAHAQSPSTHDYNSFCNALTTTAGGRLLMVGGNSVLSTMQYDPWTGAQTMGRNVNRARWYATVLRRPDDRLLVLGGGDSYATGAYLRPQDNSVVATTPEIGDGPGGWTSLTGATSTAVFGAENNRWWYPRAFNAPDGSVFGISGDRLWRMSTSGKGEIATTGTLGASLGASGTTVMYAPGKVLALGGGEPGNNATDDGTWTGKLFTASNSAVTIDITGPTPVVRPTGSLIERRHWANATVLPTGEVLVTGGTGVGTQPTTAKYAGEIWNPRTGQWRPVASAQRIRTYHSTALLLPSGAVFTGGGGIPGPEDNFNAETYYPPYLFTKDGDGSVRWASRPKLTSIAGDLAWGGTIRLGVGDARAISEVNLISAATVTHSQNTDQRRVPLAFNQGADGTLTVKLPEASAAMASGTYLLQAVDRDGVPSPSQMVTFVRDGAGKVTIYEPDESGEGGPALPVEPVSGTVPLTRGTAVSLQPEAFPGHRVRHQNALLRIDPVDAQSAQLAREDATFTVRRGLASGDGVSFESVNYPGWFLSIGSDRRGVLRRDDGSAAFARDATFLAVHGLSGQNTSFALYADPKLYLRYTNSVIAASALDPAAAGRREATFVVRSPMASVATTALQAGQRIALQSVNYPAYRIRHQMRFRSQALRISPVDASSPKSDRDDSIFTVRPGLAGGGGISLESVNYPGWYVRVFNGAASLAPRIANPVFADSATFSAQRGLAGSGVSLALAFKPTWYLRHAWFMVYSQPLDGSELSRNDASFTVVPAG